MSESAGNGYGGVGTCTGADGCWVRSIRSRPTCTIDSTCSSSGHSLRVLFAPAISSIGIDSHLDFSRPALPRENTQHPGTITTPVIPANYIFYTSEGKVLDLCGMRRRRGGVVAAESSCRSSFMDIPRWKSWVRRPWNIFWIEPIIPWARRRTNVFLHLHNIIVPSTSTFTNGSPSKTWAGIAHVRKRHRRTRRECSDGAAPGIDGANLSENVATIR